MVRSQGLTITTAVVVVCVILLIAVTIVVITIAAAIVVHKRKRGDKSSASGDTPDHIYDTVIAPATSGSCTDEVTKEVFVMN